MAGGPNYEMDSQLQAEAAKKEEYTNANHRRLCAQITRIEFFAFRIRRSSTFEWHSIDWRCSVIYISLLPFRRHQLKRCLLLSMATDST